MAILAAVYLVILVLYLLRNPLESFEPYTRIYPPVPYEYSGKAHLAPLASDAFYTGVPWLGLAVEFLYFMAACVVGLWIIQTFASGLKTKRWVIWGLAIIPGYFSIVAFNRFITVLLPEYLAVPIALIAPLFLASKLTYERIKKRRLSFSVDGKALLKDFFIVFGILIFFLIHNALIFDQYLAGDNTRDLIAIFSRLRGTPDTIRHLALFDQHYDEFLFNYPLMMSKLFKHISLVPFWLQTSILRMSAFFLCFALIQSWTVVTWYAWIAVLFLFFGSQCLNPSVHLYLFGGSNPMGYVLNFGMIFAALAPFFLMTYFSKRNPSEGKKGIFRDVVLGISMAALTMQNTFYASLTAAFVFCFYQYIYRQSFQIPVKKRAFGKVEVVLFCSYFLLPAINFELAFSYRLFLRGELIFLSLLMALIHLLFVELSLPASLMCLASRVAPVARMAFVFAMSLMVWAMCFGNFLSVHVRNLILRVFPQSGGFFAPMFSRGIFTPSSDFKIMFSGCEPFYGSVLHCVSIWSFFGHFGTVLFPAIAAFYLLSRSKNLSVQDYFLKMALVLMASLFSFGLLFTDFFQFGLGSQVLNRFLEVPYYSLAVISLVVLGRFLPKKQLACVSVIFLVWVLVPTVTHHHFEQWWVNLQYLISVIRK